jgi:acyl-CoA synthetase (AMP-forming)/AMP-acid ligase II
MTSVSLRELADSEGDGYLVGRPSHVAELALCDLPEFAPKLGPEGLTPYQVPSGHSGEVLVRGPHVNRGYIGDDEAQRRYKVPMPDGSLWHRTGDLARWDHSGRLWLTGRIADRVPHKGHLLYPYVIESAIANEIPAARCAALIAHEGAKNGELVLCCDPQQEATVIAAAKVLLARRGLDTLPVHRIDDIPMDARHNSKIDRPLLREHRQRKTQP